MWYETAPKDVKSMELGELKRPLAPTRAHQMVRRSNRNNKWSLEEDAKLISIVSKGIGELGWPEIASNFPDKKQQQVIERWTKVLDPTLTKGSWTLEEDRAILDYVRNYDTKSWTKLARTLPGRTGKQCRERWVNHLDPDLNHEAFSPEEDLRIMELHQIHGNKWVKIASYIPTRSCNAIKNRWNSTLKRGLNSSSFSVLVDDQLHGQVLPESVNGPG
jgi:hypothetical protein